jgi:hypothetical protein
VNTEHTLTNDGPEGNSEEQGEGSGPRFEQKKRLNLGDLKGGDPNRGRRPGGGRTWDNGVAEVAKKVFPQ